MVCYSLQSGYDIGEDHAGFGRTLSLGQTLYMFLLQFAFLLVYLILQSNDLLHMGFIALGEHFYSITDDLVDHFQHISQFLLGFLTDGNAFFLTLSGSIRHVLRMVTDTLDIVHHMEQGTQTVQILDGQCGLVDLYQIVRDGMVQEIDIFLYLVDLLNVLFIQRDQGIQCTDCLLYTSPSPRD